MGNLTPWEICVWVVAAILAVAGAVNAVGAAVEKISKAVKAAKAPDQTQNDRLDKLEQDVEKIKGFLSNDDARLKKLGDGNRVTQRALLALLAHGIDGNNTEQMKKAKTELEELLINR